MASAADVGFRSEFGRLRISEQIVPRRQLFQSSASFCTCECTSSCSRMLANVIGFRILCRTTLFSTWSNSVVSQQCIVLLLQSGGGGSRNCVCFVLFAARGTAAVKAMIVALATVGMADMTATRAGSTEAGRALLDKPPRNNCTEKKRLPVYSAPDTCVCLTSESEKSVGIRRLPATGNQRACFTSKAFPERVR